MRVMLVAKNQKETKKPKTGKQNKTKPKTSGSFLLLLAKPQPNKIKKAN